MKQWCFKSFASCSLNEYIKNRVIDAFVLLIDKNGAVSTILRFFLWRMQSKTKVCIVGDFNGVTMKKMRRLISTYYCSILKRADGHLSLLYNSIRRITCIKIIILNVFRTWHRCFLKINLWLIKTFFSGINMTISHV